MAIDMAPADDARVEFGDIAAIAGLTKMSVALTVNVDVVQLLRLVGQWGAGATQQAFLVSIAVTNELSLAVSLTATFGRRTSALDISAGDLLRFLITWDGSAAVDDSMKFWVNGVEEANVAWVGGTNQASLRNAIGDVFVGREQASGNDGVDGQYSEVAIWDHIVPDWVAIAYGKGMSPRFYRTGGILYCKMVNTGYLIDEWGGNDGTNTGGVSAAHPRVYYPAPSLIGAPPAAAVAPVTAKTISVAATHDATVGVPSGAGSISVKEKDEATI